MGLLDLSLIAGIGAEPEGGAHLDPDEAARLVREQLLWHLRRLMNVKPAKLVARRAQHFRAMGKFERGWMKIARNFARFVRISVMPHAESPLGTSQQK